MICRGIKVVNEVEDVGDVKVAVLADLAAWQASREVKYSCQYSLTAVIALAFSVLPLG